MVEESRFRVLKYNPAKAGEVLAGLIENPIGFVMVGDGCYMIGFAAESWHSDGLVANELALYVEPSRRGGLKAVRLIQQYVKWAKDLGCILIEAGISTGVHPEIGQRIYEACGFRHIGPIMEYRE